MVSERDGLYASANADHSEPTCRSKIPCESTEQGDHTVSVVHTGSSQVPVLSLQPVSSTVGVLCTFPEVGGWGHLALQPEAIVLPDKKLQKMVKASKNSLDRLGCFIGSARSAFNPSDDKSLCKVRAVQSVSSSKGAFISTADPSKGLGRLVFTQTHIKYANGFSSTQYLRSRCATIQPEQLRGATIEARHGIDINTGMCLFSRALISKDVKQCNGGHSEVPVPPIPQKAPITMYEAEIITRLSTSIADTVGLIRHSAAQSEVPVRVNIDIPEFQYYWTPLELLRQGKVSTSYVQGWMAAIDERKRQLFAVLEQCITASLKRRGLRGVDIISASGTESAADLFKRKVATTSETILNATFEEFLGALQNDGDDAWRWKEFLEHLKDDQCPSNFQDLCKLIYVFKAVKPFLARQGAEEGIARAPGLVIQLDDINEYKIFEKAKAFIAQYSIRLPIVGLNPMEKIFPSGPGRSSFYLEDPGQIFSSDAGNQTMDPIDVIGATYGAQFGDLLRLACRFEGLLVGVA